MSDSLDPRVLALKDAKPGDLFLTHMSSAMGLRESLCVARDSGSIPDTSLERERHFGGIVLTCIASSHEGYGISYSDGYLWTTCTSIKRVDPLDLPLYVYMKFQQPAYHSLLQRLRCPTESAEH